MTHVFIGFDESGNHVPRSLRLSRAESASYAGISEAGIRDAEDRGLPYATDSKGQSWLLPEDLDAWPWRAKLPSEAKRKTVLKKAVKSREHEARIHQQQEEKRWAEEDREADAYHAEQRRQREADEAVEEDVKKQNETAKATFLSENLDARAVKLALGLTGYDASLKIRELSRSGLLREVEPPLEIKVRWRADEPRRAEPGILPVVSGGPYYSREDLLRLHAESEERRGMGSERLAKTQPSAADDPIAQLLEFLFEVMKKNGR